MQLSQLQIEEQLALERLQISGGLERLRTDTQKLERKEYASATIYGRCSIDELLPKFIEGINLKYESEYKTATGYQKNLFHNYIVKLDSQSGAAITIKRTFDKVFSPKRGDNSVTNVTIAIGSAIEAECQMRHYESVCPGLLHVLKEKYWHESKGTQQKLTSIQTVINKSDAPKWKKWGRSTCAKVGSWYLDIFVKITEWFNKKTIQQGRKKIKIVVFTEEFIKHKDEIIKYAEAFSPLTLPMFIPPRDWTILESGGYYLNDLNRCHDMVRRGPPLCIQGEIPLSFLNKIQKIAYTLNPFVVKVAEHFDSKGQEIGKFRPIINYEVTNKPLDIADNPEARKEYNKKETDRRNKQSQEFRRSCRTRMIMNSIKQFKDRDRYYIPWSFDYRGRTYPIPSFLTPQDSDFGKSLIRFADESALTKDAEDWLSFQVATCYGLDKATMSERLAWTKANESLIKCIANDPIKFRHDWEVAEEPWQFLSACEEYYSCVISQSRDTTGLPVAIDATCSGLQILAGLARDKRTAQLVNVLPADNPQDAYKVVAECAKPNIPQKLHSVWDRKSVKRTVMTIPYNAKPFSNRSYIRDALKEKGIEIDKEELTQTVVAVRDAMNKEFPGPMQVMKWIESEVTKAIKRGNTDITWTTPSGFNVTQRLMKKKFNIIELKLLGRCRIKVADGETDKVDLAHHKNATAPNLIHSLDASLLHIAVTKFDNPIALIHDSVLSRATDMKELSTIVRETYMHLFAEHDYLQNFAKAITKDDPQARTEPPIIGDLEPSNVIDSTYFFC